MIRWWCSWYADLPRPAIGPCDERPWLGWWCSGNTCGEQVRYTMCGWIEADSPENVWAVVVRDWPELAHGEWRIAPTPHPHPPDAGRFPPAEVDA